jgi:polysaccharide biosynthesis transport protein
MSQTPVLAEFSGRAGVVALCVATALAFAYGLTPLLPKQYAASASFIAGSEAAGGREVLASRAVAMKVAQNLSVDAYPEQLLRGLNVAAERGSSVVRVVYTSADPGFAAAAANAFVRAYAGRNLTVLDEASVPRSPVSPDLRLNLALGAAAGLALGVMLSLLGGRRRLRGDGELVRALGVPLAWACTPRSADAASRSAEEETLHSLASQLKERWLESARTPLVVVSARPGEGRSYVAARLACVFAERGEPTLLIDADLRAPGQHRIFRQDNRGGLAELLGGERVEPVRIRENLWLMVAGEARRSPLQLLVRNELRVLLKEAARRFSVVLIDTPSARKGPDLEMLLAISRGAIVVARDDYSRTGELERLRAVLRRCSARLVGTVLAES